MRKSLLALSVLALVGLMAVAAEKQPAATEKSAVTANAPRFTADGQLIRP